MRKISEINLIGVPWPVNLLKCSQHTGDMRPGDEMVITLEDEGVKNSLLLILNRMPGVSVDVSTKGPCYAIKVTKISAGNSARDSDFISGN